MPPRRQDPAATAAAYEAAHESLRTWVGGVTGSAWSRPSVLPGWTVSDLAAHLVLVADSVAALRAAPRGATALSVAEYVASYRGAAEAIDERTRSVAGGTDRTVDDVLAALDERLGSARERLGALGAGNPVVLARRGPIRLGDFLATRVVELVVHADDLGRSVPEAGAPELPQAAVRTAVRSLLDALAERAPGHSVEVRVPPYAAVQCVAGPRHTRGTPPGVIETDATTWLRLAAGRVSWADAAGTVSASGARTDLSPYLPLL